jgi:hypothetical protein
MIFADLHGKLGSGYQKAHERGEDLLTSTVFGLLRYLPFDQGLGAVLRRARVVQNRAGEIVCALDSDWLRLSDGLSRPLEFWPRLRRGGEPDMRLTLAGGKEVVLIEVKLHSGKSQLAEDDPAADDEEAGGGDATDEREARIDPDQLVRYFEGQSDELSAGARLSIIYLTSHVLPPLAELQESFRRAKRGDIRLAWLSWRDVWAVAEAAKAPASGDGPAADIAALLRHKGLYQFNGFRLAELPNVQPGGRFWFERRRPVAGTRSFFKSCRNAGASDWTGVRGLFFARRERTRP